LRAPRVAAAARPGRLTHWQLNPMRKVDSFSLPTRPRVINDANDPFFGLLGERGKPMYAVTGSVQRFDDHCDAALLTHRKRPPRARPLRDVGQRRWAR